jgi:hypothetical protein
MCLMHVFYPRAFTTAGTKSCTTVQTLLLNHCCTGITLFSYARSALVHDGRNQILYSYRSRAMHGVCLRPSHGLDVCFMHVFHTRSALVHDGGNQVSFYFCMCFMLAPRLFMTIEAKSRTNLDPESCIVCARGLASALCS